MYHNQLRRQQNTVSQIFHNDASIVSSRLDKKQSCNVINYICILIFRKYLFIWLLVVADLTGTDQGRNLANLQIIRLES